MSSPLEKIKSYLDERRIPYDSIHHRRDYSAQKTAADTHTPGKEFAKTIILTVDKKFCMFVLPAHKKVDLDMVKRSLGAKEVRLATETEFSGICTGCEVGAMPPLGMLYNLPVYISHDLTEDRLITFNAGTHEDVIRMSYSDYAKIARPQVLNLTFNH